MIIRDLRKWITGLAGGIVFGLGTAVVQAQNEFPLKEGDTWVMAGDSITAQHLHTNYIEAFFYARFPKMTFCFRNSGVSGDTIPKLMERFAWDVAAWNPTVVSVELGMNDARGYPPEKFVENMAALLGKIRAANARPVLFSASPVNDGSSLANPSGGNKLLKEYAEALKILAEKEKVPYADQFTTLVDFWARNKPQENIANTLVSLKSLLAARPDLAGAEHIKAFIEVWKKKGTQPVAMMGDAVHPGPTGQLTMAATLLAKLNAPGLVSSADIDGITGAVGATAQCKIENIKTTGDVLVFARLDDALPFPVADDARPAATVLDTVAGLSQYTLTVSGLSAATYDVAIDGVKVATVSATDLAKGWNMGLLDKGPIADQCRSILQLVGAKEGLVGQWRSLSRAITNNGSLDQQDQLTKLTAQVKEADGKIRAVAQPKLHHFELTPSAGAK